MEVVLTSGNFEKEVYDSEIPVLVDFYACLLYTSDAADD